ncbi:CHAP domain-containing protein [Actinomadura atramentaria]|uniref:CHAP domain-containing protein n=1 Tax=Actinomadura atramentaria TaxID=1990 RepID=UPI00036FB9DD|nr:CHAP domain-containing protein [Actinomadura atramentaria]
MIGKYRNSTPLSVALRTTGTLVAGAALAGTALTGVGSAQAATGPETGKHVPQDAVSAPRAPLAADGDLGDGLKGRDSAQDRFDARHDDGGRTPELGDGGRDHGAPVVPDDEGDRPAHRGHDGGADGGTGSDTGLGGDHGTGRGDEPKVTAQDVIRQAESQVGVKEDGSGETKFQDWYMSTDRAKETTKRDGGSIGAYKDASWCSMFVSWVGTKVGFSDQVGQDAWTIAHAKWFKSHDRWGTKPKPGAVVFFNWDGKKSLDDIEHVGFVVKDNGDGTVKTVEGNTGNAVKTKTRDLDQIVGFGYPNYAK